MRRVLFVFLIVQAFLISSVVPMRSALAYDTFEMLNATGRTIYWVYFVPSHETSWGSDRLNGVWNSGDFLTLDTPKWKWWSLKIVFKDGSDSYWDSDNAIDTETWSRVIIKPNGNGGYTLTKQN